MDEVRHRWIFTPGFGGFLVFAWILGISCAAVLFGLLYALYVGSSLVVRYLSPLSFVIVAAIFCAIGTYAVFDHFAERKTIRTRR